MVEDRRGNGEDLGGSAAYERNMVSGTGVWISAFD
jgi:hypothetical protein